VQLATRQERHEGRVDLAGVVVAHEEHDQVTAPGVAQVERSRAGCSDDEPTALDALASLGLRELLAL
jgi:hypothetical protein